MDVLARLFLFKACCYQLAEELGAKYPDCPYQEDTFAVDYKFEQHVVNWGNVDVDDGTEMNVEHFQANDSAFKARKIMETNYLSVI